MRRALSALALVAAVLSIQPAPAASLFGSDGLDPAWCRKPAPRQTVLYIDDMMMTEGRTDWATKLAGKLRATLAPGESVSVVRLLAATGHHGH